jgi:hypothetical protein
VTCKNAIFAIFQICHQDLFASSPALATHHTMSDSESSIGGAAHSRAGPAKTRAKRKAIFQICHQDRPVCILSGRSSEDTREAQGRSCGQHQRRP